jgi:hypothetical protein
MQKIRSEEKIFTSVRKRDGRVVAFDQDRITNAIYRAMEATGEGNLTRDPRMVSDRVVKSLLKKFPTSAIPSIEEIQDIVEENLILSDFPKTAKSYILYRQQRAAIRERQRHIPERIKKFASESKKYFHNPLAEFVYYRSYSRWVEEESRRETWIETVDRYIQFMKENLGERLTEAEYSELREAILNQEAMPSMRLMWSAGKAARKTNVSAYNCSYIAPAKLEDFAEIMYLSMCGTGVGFSVESQTVQQLPLVLRKTGKKLPTHTIEDSKEGWCDALTLGLKTWYAGKDIDFDYSELRPAGAALKTMGGKSSGPDPLRSLLNFTRAKIINKEGKRLSNLDVHDIICKIGEVVVAGGVRRSALISLSDLDDVEMRGAKTGQFYLTNPQRSMANNSAVYNEKPSATEFLREWLALAESGSGERGIFNRGGLHKQLPARRWKTFQKYAGTAGTNPCLTGDTLVYVADGRGHVPIRQLAQEGKDVPVFCFNEGGKVVVRSMRHPRLTGKNQPVYSIHLDDGSVIKATSNHKFRLRTGEYKEVERLESGDSLSIISKFESPVAPHERETQDYWWINDGRFSSNFAEHRLIASFHYNRTIPAGSVVHHKDKNAKNNRPENLEIMTKENHDAFHAALMTGDRNPMRRARSEWSPEQWILYKSKHSKNNKGNNNKNYSGVTDEELQKHAICLTQSLGRRFSNGDWIEYARKHHLPQHFSKWRRDHVGGVCGLAKWAALMLGFEHVSTDPRVVRSYAAYTSAGYDCEIRDGRLVIIKKCEICQREFQISHSHREYGVCSISCGLKKKWTDGIFRKDTMRRMYKAHHEKKEKTRRNQAQIYSDLTFALQREPLKVEWIQLCRERAISSEIARKSSPFRNYAALEEYAAYYNHKVVSVEFSGYADVYNGTVDEFHNFFIGGFASTTKNGKRKFVYINNLNCGEIILRSKQFCNLTEVVARAHDTKESLLKKIRWATILGTYQSALTHFPVLSKEWKKNCEEERLLGVSITGQWDSKVARDPHILGKLKMHALEVNKEYAKRFGINESTCITCVKPSGTVSQLVDASSGMHPRHSKYYIRRIRISATDKLFHMLKDQKFPYHPEVGQVEGSATTYVLEFPVKSPAGSIFRNDLSALEQLEYWKVVKEHYTEHNPSVTISVGEREWVPVADWLYKNWDMIGGLSFLPREEHVYRLAPYEEIDEKRYHELIAKLPEIDFSKIIAYEEEDMTIGAKELACVGGACEIDFSAGAGVSSSGGALPTISENSSPTI